MRVFKNTILLLVLIILPHQALASNNIRKITVTGKSEIVIEAQYAVIGLIIKEVNNEMTQSHNELLKTISNLTNRLKDIGIPDKDIKKSLILQGQEHSWENGSDIFKGYYSECFIDLYIKNIEKISAVYKEFSNFQDITIRNTDFRRNDEFDIRKAEFEKALQIAKQKAEFMAQALGVKIGKVYTIQELSSGNFATTNIYTQSRTVGSGDDQTGYGTIKITALVAVDFELE